LGSTFCFWKILYFVFTKCWGFLFRNFGVSRNSVLLLKCASGVSLCPFESIYCSCPPNFFPNSEVKIWSKNYLFWQKFGLFHFLVFQWQKMLVTSKIFTGLQICTRTPKNISRVTPQKSIWKFGGKQISPLPPPRCMCG